MTALHEARDRALGEPLDRPALDAFIRAAAALAGAMAVDPGLSGEGRHEAGRLARSRYAQLADDIATGRTEYRLARDDETEGGPVRMVLPDGTGFDAVGFVRRLSGDWDAVAKAA
ncbi:MAG TPA: hypothetical protein VFO41_07535 [Alphaproteobacteria bacterium]|nr:hypothetical protein [Alphaproteobacteria bacterium]